MEKKFKTSDGSPKNINNGIINVGGHNTHTPLAALSYGKRECNKRMR
jgi:hypothetical protein